MKYEKMIQTEDTDCLYDMWQDYRENLTAYIIASVEHDYIRSGWSRKPAECQACCYGLFYRRKNISC